MGKVKEAIERLIHGESLSEKQAEYLGIPQFGPFKPEYYRY